MVEIWFEDGFILIVFASMCVWMFADCLVRLVGEDMACLLESIKKIRAQQKEIRKTKKEQEMKLWKKHKRFTATDDFVDFILMKLYEEPEAWERGKYKTDCHWWQYKQSNIFVGDTRPGEVQDGNGAMKLSKKQMKLITASTANMRAAQALRKMTKAALNNSA